MGGVNEFEVTKEKFSISLSSHSQRQRTSTTSGDGEHELQSPTSVKKGLWGRARASSASPPRDPKSPGKGLGFFFQGGSAASPRRATTTTCSNGTSNAAAGTHDHHDVHETRSLVPTPSTLSPACTSGEFSTVVNGSGMLEEALKELASSRIRESTLQQNLDLATATIRQLQEQLAKGNHTVEILLEERKSRRRTGRRVSTTTCDTSGTGVTGTSSRGESAKSQDSAITMGDLGSGNIPPVVTDMRENEKDSSRDKDSRDKDNLSSTSPPPSTTANTAPPVSTPARLSAQIRELLDELRTQRHRHICAHGEDRPPPAYAVAAAREIRLQRARQVADMSSLRTALEVAQSTAAEAGNRAVEAEKVFAAVSLELANAMCVIHEREIEGGIGYVHSTPQHSPRGSKHSYGSDLSTSTSSRDHSTTNSGTACPNSIPNSSTISHESKPHVEKDGNIPQISTSHAAPGSPRESQAGCSSSGPLSPRSKDMELRRMIESWKQAQGEVKRLHTRLVEKEVAVKSLQDALASSQLELHREVEDRKDAENMHRTAAADWALEQEVLEKQAEVLRLLLDGRDLEAENGVLPEREMERGSERERESGVPDRFSVSTADGATPQPAHSERQRSSQQLRTISSTASLNGDIGSDLE